MIEVGAFEAKTHLSSLLNKVIYGEEVLITKRGKAVARLVSADRVDSPPVSASICELLTLRKEVTLRGIDWKMLRDQGRR